MVDGRRAEAAAQASATARRCLRFRDFRPGTANRTFGTAELRCPRRRGRGPFSGAQRRRQDLDLKSIMGMIPKRRARLVRSTSLTHQGCLRQNRALGVAFCPEERGIFASLNVYENLILPPTVRSGGLTLEQIFDLFPNLKERLSSSQGTKLSGGEQQMLAIARILRTGARFLMLDEPTEGLAPVIIQQIGRTIQRLKSEGFTILLVEQNFRLHPPSRIASTSLSTAR